jgi:hypothetical protein
MKTEEIKQLIEAYKYPNISFSVKEEKIHDDILYFIRLETKHSSPKRSIQVVLHPFLPQSFNGSPSAIVRYHILNCLYELFPDDSHADIIDRLHLT